MTVLGWLLVGAAVLAVVAGVRRSRYEGTPPRVWWAEQRMYRRPSGIARRLGQAVAAASLLTASIAALLVLIGVVLAAVTAVGLAVAAWYGLRVAARRATPPTYPVERLDLDLPHQAPADSPTYSPPAQRGEIESRPSNLEV